MVPVRLIFGVQNPEEISHQKIVIFHVNNVAAQPYEMQKIIFRCICFQ